MPAWHGSGIRLCLTAGLGTLRPDRVDLIPFVRSGGTHTVTGDWPGKRQEIAYTEARAVIEAQNATMTDIDDKAMRTVRLNAVLLGLLVTGLQFAPGLFARTALEVTFAFLIGSTICGVITYNESNLYVGPRGDYVEALAKDEFPDPPWTVTCSKPWRA